MVPHDTQEQPRAHASGGEEQRGKQHADRRGEGDGELAALVRAMRHI